MLIKRFQQLAQWVGFLAIAGLALYGFMSLGSGRLWAAENEYPSTETDAPEVTIPATFNYQGFLRNPDGTPMGGTHTITVKLWQTITGGTSALYDETFPNISVRDGLFNVVLGSTKSMSTSHFQIAPLFVGVAVDSDPELLPRQRLHPVPWALLSENATNATNAANATNATNAATATTLVSGASVSNLKLNGITKFGDAGSTSMQEYQGKVYFTEGNGLYVDGDTEINGSINGEKPPMVLEIGQNTNTTLYYWSGPVDIGPLCGDADGCTMKFLMRVKSTDEVRVIEETLYIEQPSKSGNKTAGLHGWTRQQGGGDAGFVLNTAAKHEVVPHPWDWIYVRNYAQIVDGTVTSGPVYSDYTVSFMTVPNIAATVIIYDR